MMVLAPAVTEGVLDFGEVDGGVRVHPPDLTDPPDPPPPPPPLLNDLNLRRRVYGDMAASEQEMMERLMMVLAPAEGGDGVFDFGEMGGGVRVHPPELTDPRPPRPPPPPRPTPIPPPPPKPKKRKLLWRTKEVSRLPTTVYSAAGSTWHEAGRDALKNAWAEDTTFAKPELLPEQLTESSVRPNSPPPKAPPDFARLEDEFERALEQEREADARLEEALQAMAAMGSGGPRIIKHTSRAPTAPLDSTTKMPRASERYRPTTSATLESTQSASSPPVSPLESTQSASSPLESTQSASSPVDSTPSASSSASSPLQLFADGVEDAAGAE